MTAMRHCSILHSQIARRMIIFIAFFISGIIDSADWHKSVGIIDGNGYMNSSKECGTPCNTVVDNVNIDAHLWKLSSNVIQLVLDTSAGSMAGMASVDDVGDAEEAGRCWTLLLAVVGGEDRDCGDDACSPFSCHSVTCYNDRSYHCGTMPMMIVTSVRLAMSRT